MRSYLSIIMLALLILPVAEKAHHELGHLAEEHCGFEGLHYCETEHHCEICDFVFSASTNPPQPQVLAIRFFNLFHGPAAEMEGACSAQLKGGLFLRGPPCTA